MSTNNPNAIEVPCPECKALVYDHVLEAMGGVCGECSEPEPMKCRSCGQPDEGGLCEECSNK